MQVLHKRLDLVVATLGLALDLLYIGTAWVSGLESGGDLCRPGAKSYRAVGCVGDEASDTDTACLLLGEGPEVDALDFALDREGNLGRGRGRGLAGWGSVFGEAERRTLLVDMVRVWVKRRFMRALVEEVGVAVVVATSWLQSCVL